MPTLLTFAPLKMESIQNGSSLTKQPQLAVRSSKTTLHEIFSRRKYGFGLQVTRILSIKFSSGVKTLRSN